MRKNTIYLAIFLVLSLLLFTSCKPAGKAIAGVPVAPADLSGYPRNVVKLDDFNNKVQFNIKADTQLYGVEINVLTGKVMTELCQLMPDTCNYNADLTTDDAAFIAAGTCDDVGQYLDASLCPLSQGKAVIQYVDNYKLIVAGGTPDDVKKGLEVLMNHNNWLLNGFYSDVINTDKIVAASHLTGTNAIEYVEKFYFTQGMNKITNPLTLPSNKQSITNFFTTVSDKINSVYYYDSTTDSYTGVYNAVPTDAPAPGNLVHFGLTDDTYIVDAKEDFSVTITDAEHPTQATLAGISTIDPYYTQEVLGAFMTGASVTGAPMAQAALITGGAVAGQTTPPDTKPIYRCYYNYHGVVNHFLTDQADCGRSDSTNIEQVGYLYTSQKPGSVPLYQCYRAVRYERPGHSKQTFHDMFQTYDSNCEGNYMDGLLGYIPENPAANTEKWYRCILTGGIRDSRYDHTISKSIACDSADWRNEGQIYNFLKTEETSQPPWDDGHFCNQDSQCNSNYCAPDTGKCEPIVVPIYRCFYNFHGVINHYLTHQQDCGRPDGSLDGLVGYLIQPSLPNTVKLVQCWRAIRTERPGHEKRTYHDHFIAANACPSGSTYEADLGHALVTSTPDTDTVYRCWALESINSGRYDHMVSKDIACEDSNYRNEGLEYYFLKTDQLPSTIPSAPAGPETKAIYRCHYSAWGVINHFMTDQADCGRDDSTSDGLYGYLYTSQKPNTVPVYQCYRAIRTERPGHEKHTYHDHYQTTDSDCEGAGTFEGLLGYAPASAVTNTTPLYRCWALESINSGRYDHMLSKALNCESSDYRNEGLVFNFLSTETPITTGPPWPNGHSCTIDADCVSGYCEQTNNTCAPEPGIPSLTFTLIDNPDPANANSTLNYTLTIGNAGTVPITGATLLVTYPSEVQYVSNSLPMSQVSNSQWSFSIPAGDTYDGEITVLVNSNVINGTQITLTADIIAAGETTTETETTTILSSIGLPPPGVPPLVPPPSPPATPPLPHQFYGLVNNGTVGMGILATMGTAQFNTTVDTNIRYGYTPLFLVTGTTNGTTILFYVNSSYDQNTTFQQGGLTRLDLTYSPGGTPPAAPSCNDNILNQDETDVDCGGTICSGCRNGEMCNVNRDCRSLKCTNGICVKKPTVAVGGGGGGGGGPARDFYGTQQPETTTKAECFDDWICDPWGPCIDGLKTRECFLNDYEDCVLELPKPSTEQICEVEAAPIEPANCFDGIKNQDETYRDCGGRMCKPCDPNLPCRTGMDCVTGYCDPMTELCGWPPSEEVVKEVPKPTSYTWLWILLGLVVLGGGGGAFYYYWTHRETGGIPEGQRLKDLKAYVAKFQKKNVPREKLRAKLEESGWKRSDIDKVLK